MTWNQVPTFLRDEEGRVFVNPAKQFVQPLELPIDIPNRTVNLVASGRSGPFPISARYDGPYEAFYIKVLVTDTNGDPLTDYNIRWFLEHPGKRIQFMPQPVPLIATAGDAGRPFVLPETIFVPRVQALTVTFFNDDLVVRNVEFVLGTIKYYENSAPEELRKEMFKYVERRERTYAYFLPPDNGFTTLTALQTDVNATVTIPDDADMEIFKLTAEATGRFRAQLRDGTNSRAIISQRLDASLIFGGHVATAMGGGLGGSGGCFPARWPTSYLARRSTQLEWTFDDLSNAGNTVRPILCGRKIRYNG